ncbi:hypothetical protein BaRGS_00000761 [Batillaria attramentaria]|uniref:medium-chain acyl-CoA ligase n=1 Tax=Batillaria attramentaria TaxID=370345 RepID=A0ABD0M8U1_9CAEN
MARALLRRLGSVELSPLAILQPHHGSAPSCTVLQKNKSVSHGVRCLNVLDVQSTYTDFEHERRTFKLEQPKYFNFARDVFDVWAAAEQTGQRDSSVPALWWVDVKGRDHKFSFDSLSKLSRRVASVLTGPCGLSRGDKIIVVLPRIPEWWMLNLACMRAGLVMSPGTIMLRAGDIRYRLNASGAKCIVVDSNTVDFVDQVDDDCPQLKCKVFVGEGNETRPGWLNFKELLSKASDSFQTVNSESTEPQSLFFTSGTTGPPKMTEHTHASYGLGHLITARYMWMCGPSDVMWNVSDTGWAKSAYSSLYSPWLHGTCVFAQESPAFDPQDMLKTLSRFPISHFCIPPTAMRVLVKEKLSDFKFQRLRHTVCGGEPVNPEMVEQWREGTGLDVYEAYGQTETTALCLRPPCVEYRPGSMGKAAPGFDIQVVDDAANPAPFGEEGMIAVRCHPQRPVGLFSRYVDDPERMASAFHGDFYLTGDRGYMDEDNYFWFVGRADDVIISAGYRIGPFEVESALLEHPGVLESAAVSSPDEVRGQVVKAFVVLTPAYQNADKEQLTKELQDHIEFMSELPKTISGKIRRVELRDEEWKGSHV